MEPRNRKTKNDENLIEFLGEKTNETYTDLGYMGQARTPTITRISVF